MANRERIEYRATTEISVLISVYHSFSFPFNVLRFYDKIEIIPPKANQILDKFLPKEARKKICQTFGWIFGRFEGTKISF